MAGSSSDAVAFANSCLEVPPGVVPRFRLFPTSYRIEVVVDFYIEQLHKYTETGDCDLKVFKSIPGLLQAREKFLDGRPDRATSDNLLRCVIVLDKQKGAKADENSGWSVNEPGFHHKNSHLIERKKGKIKALLIQNCTWKGSGKKRRRTQEDLTSPPDVRPYTVYPLTTDEAVAWVKCRLNPATTPESAQPDPALKRDGVRLVVYLPSPDCHPDHWLCESLPSERTASRRGLTPVQKDEVLQSVKKKILQVLDQESQNGASLHHLLEQIILIIEADLEEQCRRWADHCFRPGYRRRTRHQIRDHILEHNKLPFLRGEADVLRTGIDPVRDMPGIVEAVEHLYLELLFGPGNEKESTNRTRCHGLAAQITHIPSFCQLSWAAPGLLSTGTLFRVLPFALLVTVSFIAVSKAQAVAHALVPVSMRTLGTKSWLVHEIQRWEAGKVTWKLGIILFFVTVISTLLLWLLLLALKEVVGRLSCIKGPRHNMTGLRTAFQEDEETTALLGPNPEDYTPAPDLDVADPGEHHTRGIAV